MSDPKLHHYVPQFYLERFTNSDGRLWVFDKKLNRKFCSSPKSLAAETKFYYISELAGTKYTPLFVEKQFSALESNIAQITGDWLNQLNNCKSRDQLKIPGFERSQMALFIALQYSCLRDLFLRQLMILKMPKYFGGEFKTKPHQLWMKCLRKVNECQTKTQNLASTDRSLPRAIVRKHFRRALAVLSAMRA